MLIFERPDRRFGQSQVARGRDFIKSEGTFVFWTETVSLCVTVIDHVDIPINSYVLFISKQRKKNH